MVVRSKVPLEQLIEEWKEESNPTKREYATFKILDRKNRGEVETSCGPEFLSNDFQKSDLPWERTSSPPSQARLADFKTSVNGRQAPESMHGRQATESVDGRQATEGRTQFFSVNRLGEKVVHAGFHGALAL